MVEKFSPRRYTTCLSMLAPNVRAMMRAIRGQPNRGFRDLSSTMAWISASLGPFGPGFFGHSLDENSRAVRATHQRLMKCQERRGAYADGDLSDSSWAEEECPESEQQPVTRCQAWRSLARTAQDDQLLLEQKILRDHRAYATGATQCRGHSGQVKQGEQEVLHARDSVGQTSGATQRGLNPGFSERIWNSRRTGDQRAEPVDPGRQDGRPSTRPRMWPDHQAHAAARPHWGSAGVRGQHRRRPAPLGACRRERAPPPADPRTPTRGAIAPTPPR